jgi:integrase
VAFVPALPADHIERDYLRLSEIGAYLAAGNDAYRPLAETLIGTEMRISEALALTVNDIDVFRSARGNGRIEATKGRRFRGVELLPAARCSLGSRGGRIATAHGPAIARSASTPFRNDLRISLDA